MKRSLAYSACRSCVASAVAVAAIVAISPARPAEAEQSIFRCSLGGKTVSVAGSTDRLTYTFGTASRAELSISGSIKSGTVFFRSDLYADLEQQIRFTNDGYSYIVYSMDANPGKGSSAVSGLLVLKGMKRISDTPCRPHADFGAFDFSSWPQDSEAYSAMSF